MPSAFRRMFQIRISGQNCLVESSIVSVPGKNLFPAKPCAWTEWHEAASSAMATKRLIAFLHRSARVKPAEGDRNNLGVGQASACVQPGKLKVREMEFRPILALAHFDPLHVFLLRSQLR
jgi:hypothetical protein